MILKNIAGAMAADSRLLIGEMVVPDKPEGVGFDKTVYCRCWSYEFLPRHCTSLSCAIANCPLSRDGSGHVDDWWEGAFGERALGLAGLGGVEAGQNLEG
jgi:hypothetical protein